LVARQALEVARMAMIEIGHAIVDMDAKTAGYIVGAIAYEAAESAAITAILVLFGAAEVGSGGLATPAVGAGVAGIVGAKAATFARLANKLTKLDNIKAFPKVVKAIEKLQDVAVMAIRYPMCFVAGTQVHTQNGMKSIETIKVGDLVLTRDENTPDSPNRYRPVTELFQTSPNRLLTIRYVVESEVEELTCTGQHPFYVVRVDKGHEASYTSQLSNVEGSTNASEVASPSTGQFCQADQLEIGDELLLADGRHATIFYIDEQQAADGETFTTYNFSVDEYHTYFVGKLGVWVHNTGNPCDEAFVVFQKGLDNGSGFTKAYRDSIQWLLDKHGHSEGLSLLRKHEDDLKDLIADGLKYSLTKDYPDLKNTKLADFVSRNRWLEPTRDSSGTLPSNASGRGVRRNTPSQAASIERHHLFPEELESKFKKVFGDDYNQDDFTVAVGVDIHKQIHGNVPKDAGGKFRGIFADPDTAKVEYNQRWKNFFNGFAGDAQPSPKQVIKFAEDLVNEFGLDL
ncbi:MAG: polymorphic toxin-type HINT domain-containing protein, partial [Pirellula sp.]|nr:Hint domain-containing protein [Pirellula sp.]